MTSSRQRGTSPRVKELAWGLSCTFVPSAGVLNIREAKNVPLFVQNEEHERETHSFNQGFTRFQIMHSWITCCRVSMLPEKYSWSVLTALQCGKTQLVYAIHQTLPFCMRKWVWLARLALCVDCQYWPFTYCVWAYTEAGERQNLGKAGNAYHVWMMSRVDVGGDSARL